MEMNKIEKIRRKLIAEGRKITNLASGNPADFGITFPEKILEKGFHEFLQNPVYHAEPKGSLKAREAVAGYYKSRGFKVDPENIILTSGTSESYFHIFRHLLSPRQEILLPNPGYPLFEHLAGLAHAGFSFYSLDQSNGWEIDIHDLESRITESTRAIVIISPNNPTGTVHGEKTLEKVLALAQKHRLAIISDEVFSEFVFDKKPFPRVATMADDIQIFTLNGISKTYALPGLKLGWIVTTGPDTAENVEHLELSVDTFLACNSIGQSMLPLIIREGEPFIKSFRNRVEESRNAALKVLSQKKSVSCVKPQGGFYLFAEINDYRDTDEDLAADILEKTGILVHPGYFYDYEKSLHILISCLMEAPKLEEQINTLVKFLP